MTAEIQMYTFYGAHEMTFGNEGIERYVNGNSEGPYFTIINSLSQKV
jgi:hypothetical protein